MDEGSDQKTCGSQQHHRERNLPGDQHLAGGERLPPPITPRLVIAERRSILLRGNAGNMPKNTLVSIEAKA